MSHQLFTNLRRSGGNFIPSGRQIPRTPPPAAVHSEDLKPPTRDPDNSDQTRTCVLCSTPRSISTADDPTSMLKGMKGYQLTPGDLEFIKKMKEEQVVRKLEGDLKELQELIKMETMALELARASREKAEAELNTFPSCEQLREWTKLVLTKTSPLTELTDMDTKSLLAMVTMEDVQSVMHEKRTELTQMRKMMANRRKKEGEEREQLEKEMASKQLKIQTLMRELCDLKSELAQQEEACKLKLKSVAASEKPTKSVKTARGKKKKVKEQEFNSQEAVGATRGKNAGAAQTTSSKPKNQRQVKAGGAQSPASEQNDQSKVNTGEAKPTSQKKAPTRSRKTSAVAADAAGQEAQNAGLRRSKRVANRR